MATPAEVLDHFAEARDGSAIGRARAAANAFRALLSLDPDEKRELAVMVADRAAPELVPRIRSETGLDLTREQVQAVVDMAGRLDADELAELRRTVEDPAAREQALRSVGTATATAATAAAGLDDLVEKPDEGPVAEEPAPADEEATEPATSTTDEAPGAPVEEAPGPPPAAEVPPSPDHDPDVLDELGVETEPVELEHEPEPSYEAAPAPEPREFESIFDTLPDTPTPDEPGRTPPAPPSTPAEPTSTTEGPAGRGRPGAGTQHRPPVDVTARVRAARHPLVERLRAQPDDASRLRLLRAGLADLRETDAIGREAIVDAVPDGWARRRALVLLLDQGIVSSAEIVPLVSRLRSEMNRVWVCASAVEAGLLAVDDLDEVLGERTVRRLQARYA